MLTLYLSLWLHLTFAPPLAHPSRVSRNCAGVLYALFSQAHRDAGPKVLRNHPLKSAEDSRAECLTPEIVRREIRMYREVGGHSNCLEFLPCIFPEMPWVLS